MAAMWEAVDKNFPTFTGRESPGEQAEQIVNYLFLLREQLKYSLGNLGRENWNEAELSQVQEASVRALSGAVARLSATCASMQEKIAGLQTTVTELQGQVDALKVLHGEQTG